MTDISCTVETERHGEISERLRGYGLVGIAATLVILFAGTPLVAALLVLLWAWGSRTPLRDLGYVKPRDWFKDAALGIIFGALFKVALKSVVMPLLGADAVNHAYQFLTGNRAALPAMVFTIIVGAGFGEETVYRGFLFARLRPLLGQRAIGTIGTIVLSAIWFGIVHYHDQGLAGAEQAAVVGLVFGAIFAATGRIWMLMVAHVSFDLVALAMIYWGAETRIAHLFFS